jgi:hypothetical protein
MVWAVALAAFLLPCRAMAEDFLSMPPSAARKNNVTTGTVTGLVSGKKELTIQIRSEADNKPVTVYLKLNQKIPVLKDGKKLKKYKIEKGMRVRAEHNNFKGSMRQLVLKLEILDAAPPKS